jgi:hypothetical protein
MSESKQVVTLIRPIRKGDKEYATVTINRPTALELLQFNLPDLANGIAAALLALVKKCGELDDGKPLPSDLELQIDMLDVIAFGGTVLYFLRGMDLPKQTETPTSNG